jgi:prevent-host-death family protein
MTNHESIPIRVLRNDVSKVIKRVEAGESFAVTRHGTTVAHLGPNDDPEPGVIEEVLQLRDKHGIDFELLDLVRGLRSDMRDPYERFEEHHQP